VIIIDMLLMRSYKCISRDATSSWFHNMHNPLLVFLRSYLH